MLATEIEQRELCPANSSFASLEEELAFYRRWIAQAADVCERSAAGDLEPRVLHVPEHGDMARFLRSLNHLLDMTDAFLRESSAAVNYVVRGKYFRRVILRGLQGSFRHAAQTINTGTEEMANQAAVVKNLEARRKEIDTQMEGVIQTLAATAGKSRDTAQTLSQTAQQADAATAAAEMVSSCIADVAASTSRLREISGEVDQKASECVNVASKASMEAASAGPVMANLANVARRVSGTVKLIAQVANQTNTLALNATIEAARAGEAGRGFAVVAAEVKDLARKTATATQEISDEIQSMERATAQVAGALNCICQQISGIDEISGVIAQAVDRQRQSADNIAKQLADVEQETRNVSSSVRSLTEVAHRTTDCVNEILECTQSLAQQSNVLRNHAADR